MTREDIITNLKYWCNNIDKPCKECKHHDMCVKRDHMMIFAKMDDRKLEEYYEAFYGKKVKVEKMEQVKTLVKVEEMTYPNGIKNIIPAKDFVKMITDKGYHVEVMESLQKPGDLWLTVYKEVEMKE